MKYAIEINNLNKIYSPNKRSKTKISALNNVNLKIKKGSFFGLLGPNGAGKSTIINILSGLVNKTSGHVKICDLDIDDQKQLAKYKIGIVPQEITFDPFFTVYETLEIYAGYYGIKKSERKTNEIINAMGLSDKSKSKPRNLSGGMKRRLLIAKSLVHSPEILVLDEPTAGVDVDLRNQLWDYVKELNKNGTTILLTTHYLEEAEQLCDEIAVINNGKVIAHDKKDKLMNILSQKDLIISVDNFDKIKKFNLKIKNTKIYKISDDKISINYDPNIISVETILKSLSEAKIEINDISTTQPDLEEIFKYLVKL
ncbi:ABC transporter ATP-binding protein [Rickettsiales bacterium]|jgi:ABC-2 type transport system ATP-binding protein|nr:ABC transporter ATP-binding protein [Rickettsiales bacterium]